ncbi:hypothetical protein N7526_004780 [Penicillium atrosanguineum]|nr:hypothetical protein N7526_004780 [Penicillium atrosanguineum]
MGPDNEKSPTESQASVDGSTADIESGIAVESKGWLHTLSQKLELLAGLETRVLSECPMTCVEDPPPPSSISQLR